MTKREKIQSIKDQSYILGSKAYGDKLQGIPSSDNDFKDLVDGKGYKLTEKIKFYTAWMSGWTNANLHIGGSV